MEVSEALRRMKACMQIQLDEMQEKQQEPHFGTVDLTKPDRTCLSYWFPKLVEDGLPVPETRIIAFGNRKEISEALFDNKHSKLVSGLAQLIDATAEISGIGYPFFLRTGHFSGKHNWDLNCYVSGPEKIAKNIANLTHAQEIVGVMAENPHSVWVIREMLPTVPHMLCSNYGNFPVTRELRVFVSDSTVKYHTAYWPEGAIKDGEPINPNWKDKLGLVTEFTESELEEILALASRAGAACGGDWSVDILDTKNGWYITDLAEANKSYGYVPENFV